ncbi:MAG: DNA/RNA nuclease SfsA [Pseudomonadales bacterium]|nr:DNA/RNA nuclease SfsA [Pseudomonadales bacterium]
MKFPQPLQEGRLIKRYKRFLADIQTEQGQTTIHCPNTGSMKNCQDPDARVWYTDSANPKRKYPCTWQIVETDGQYLVGINTSLANHLVGEAITSGVVTELNAYEEIRYEVPYGNQKSRIDILLQSRADAEQENCYVEIKNVSLGLGDGLGLFPDAVTTRGHKHLQELIDVKKNGERAVLFFCVQHTGIDHVRPADDIDPEYGRLLRLAQQSGVELIAYGAEFDLLNSRVELRQKLLVEC